MIAPGHLVQDWMGRAGITLRPCDPPVDEVGETGDDSLAVLTRGGERASRWWEVALFSGVVVKSPERLTYSWGPTDRAVVEWAIKRVDRVSGRELAGLLEAAETVQGPN